MHWNHRVMRHVDKKNGGVYFAIHETYYGVEGESGDIWTEQPVAVIGESVDGLRQTLERMLKALDKPVLEYGEQE